MDNLFENESEDRIFPQEDGFLTENQKKLQSYLDRIRLSPTIKQTGEGMKEEIRQEVNVRINKSVKRNLMMKLIGAAASILLLMGFSNYYFYQKGYENRNSQWIKMINPLGMRSVVSLPDGSNVILNAGTTLFYPSAFIGQNREVRIEGEAFFTVEKDEKKPFVVLTDEIVVKVTGTTFNVKAYDDEDKVEVTLESGSVDIELNENNMIHLNPDQQLVYNKKERSVEYKTVNTNHYLSYKEGKFYFYQRPLHEIAKQLERSFNVHIDIVSEALKDIVFTGDFVREENLEQILKVMAADKRLVYEMNGDYIRIDKIK